MIGEYTKCSRGGGDLYMSQEALLFLGILLSSFGLDEYLPARKVGPARIPVKLIVGIISIIVALLSGRFLLK